MQCTERERERERERLSYREKERGLVSSSIPLANNLKSPHVQDILLPSASMNSRYACTGVKITPNPHMLVFIECYFIG